MRIVTPCILFLPALAVGGLLKRDAQPAQVVERDVAVPAPGIPVAVLHERADVLERRRRPGHFAPHNDGHGGNPHVGGYPGNAHNEGHDDEAIESSAASPSVEAAPSTEVAPAPSPEWTPSAETTTAAAPTSSAAWVPEGGAPPSDGTNTNGGAPPGDGTNTNGDAPSYVAPTPGTEATSNAGLGPAQYSENAPPAPEPTYSTGEVVVIVDYSTTYTSTLASGVPSDSNYVPSPAPAPAPYLESSPQPTTTWNAPHGWSASGDTTASAGDKGVTSPAPESTHSFAPGVVSEYVFTQWVETKINSTSRTWVPKTITLHFHTMSPAPAPGQGEIGLGTLTGSAGQTQTIVMGAAPSKSPSWVKGAVAAAGAGIVGMMI